MKPCFFIDSRIILKLALNSGNTNFYTEILKLVFKIGVFSLMNNVVGFISMNSINILIESVLWHALSL